jgi:pimeloyl-ACP methyl ester carboxylesterase
VKKIRYNSVNPDMTPQDNSDSSALLITPNKDGEYSLCSYQHGTKLLRSEAPSQFEPFSSGVIKFVECYINYILAGFFRCAFLLPDYQGMGEDIKETYNQPYMAAEPLAKSVVDAIDTAIGKYIIADKWNQNLYLIGYSQGGFVTMAAARLWQSLKKKPYITKCAPMGGPYFLSGSMRKIMTSKEGYPACYFLPMSIRGYYHRYANNSEKQKFFTEDAFNKDPDFRPLWKMVDGKRNNEKQVEDWIKQKSNIDLPQIILDENYVNQLDDPNSEQVKILMENETYKDWPPQYDNHTLPFMLLHALDDTYVPYENAYTAFKKLACKEKTYGLDVNLIPVIGNHIMGYLLSMLVITSWLKLNLECDDAYK